MILARSALCLCMLLVLSVSPVAQAESSEDTHPFSVHDMLAMDRVADPQVSPDGRQVAFVVRETDLKANRGLTDLWIVGIDGSGLRRLTTDPAADGEPRWSHDGKSLYFVSTRSGSSQVWRLPLDGGEARQVTDEPLDVGNLKLSPDGRRIAYSMEVFPGTTPDQTRKRLDERAESKHTGQLYDSLFFRHWDTWADGRRSHVFVRDIGEEEPTAAVDIMPDFDADCPSKPFGGSEEFTFTRDGAGVVFTARVAGREEAWSTNMDLYHVEPGKAALRNLTDANEAADTQPVFSPDGRRLAWLRQSRPGYESDKFDIVVRDWPDGEDRLLTGDWDFSAGSLAWSADGHTIYTTAARLGQVAIFAIDASSGNARLVVENGSVGAVQVARDNIVFALDHLKSPVELYTMPASGKESAARAITAVNAEKLAKVRMGDAEQFSFTGWNNEKVYGYVLKPADFEPERKYPVAFLIHGGPQGSFGNHFHYRWNPQAYAGAGYAVVMVDFHGSTGYGQAFCDSIRGDWGGKPLEDLQKGLAAAIEKYPWMDGDRVAALGASYGGYMINWIAGNWPDRFRCLVSHDGNLDERMAYFDTEELWFPEWDHGGTPWENPQGFTKHNPIDHVSKWKTPMLVIHGGRDYRVVDTQGMSTFTALQRRGIPSKFLYFPDENHWVLKPANSLQWHETVLEWLDEWTKE